MKKYITTILLLFAGMWAMAQATLTPSQILGKVTGVITSGKGVEANFTVTQSGYTGKGQLRISGSKFNVRIP